MGHTRNMGNRKLNHISKNGSYLKDWATLQKLGHNYKKGVSLVKLRHNKWVILQKIGHTTKNGSQSEKWVTLGKMGHT